MTKTINRNYLKYIAAAAMLLDHTAVIFLTPATVPYFIMRLAGRLTAPIMAYFISEGYIHTKNIRNYILRLFFFWIISWIPFSLAFQGGLPVEIISGRLSGCTKHILFSNYKLYIEIPSKAVIILFRLKTDVIFTLLLGLLALITVNSNKLNSLSKVIILAVIFSVSMIGDWKYFNVLFPLIFYHFRENMRLKNISYYLICILKLIEIDKPEKLYYSGILAVPVILSLYNGKPGRKNKFNKWFFYIFYPMHLLLLYLIKQIVFK